MKREQKILVTAISTLLGGTLLSIPQAMAVYDLTAASAPSPVVYASELSGEMNLNGIETIKIHLGPGLASDATIIGGGATAYVRLDLTNATIGNGSQPTLFGAGGLGTGGIAFSSSNTVDCPALYWRVLLPLQFPPVLLPLVAVQQEQVTSFSV